MKDLGISPKLAPAFPATNSISASTTGCVKFGMSATLIIAKSGFGPSSLSCFNKSNSRTTKHCTLSKVQAGLFQLVPATQDKVCSKRQVLLGGASLLLAPLLAQQASAEPASVKSADSTAPSFNGFDGVGGVDADYANAEVQQHTDPSLALTLPIMSSSILPACTNAINPCL